MVAPVTGPFTRTETVVGPPINTGFKPVWLVYNRSWYRQRRPYNLPLSFSYQRGQVLSWTGPGASVSYTTPTANGDSIYSISPSPSQHFPNTYNKAYGKFKSEAVPNSASLGIALAQRKQAISMIAERALQLALFAKQLRSGQFKNAARTIGLTSQPKGWRKKGKTFGDRFLEAHFGWSPLMRDIGSAVDVLQGGVPPARIRVSASHRGSYVYTIDPNSNPLVKREGKDFATWTIGADVIVDNPNLWLANQLGFVNPATVALDAVPFSFVLNWFVNVDQFLAAFTDFHGLSLLRPYTTFHWERRGTEYRTQKNWPKPGVNTLYTTGTYVWIRTVRSPGSIPGPSLRFKDPWILSPLRGITAIALLLQRLK